MNLIGAAVLATALVALAGCVGPTGMKGSAKRACYDSGLQPGTQEFKSCWQRLAGQDNSDVGRTLLGLAAVAAAAASAQPARRPLLDEPNRFLAPQKPKECRYWTNDGWRVMQAVNGVCPARYGE